MVLASSVALPNFLTPFTILIDVPQSPQPQEQSHLLKFSLIVPLVKLSMSSGGESHGNSLNSKSRSLYAILKILSACSMPPNSPTLDPLSYL